VQDLAMVAALLDDATDDDEASAVTL